MLLTVRTYIELWSTDLGSVESTQEARVALDYRLGQLLRFFRALQIDFPRAP